MAWEDPLKLGRNKKRTVNVYDAIDSTLNLLSDDSRSFTGNVIQADFLSNFALAVICEGGKINYDTTINALFGANLYEGFPFWQDIEGSCEELELPFLSSLALSFQNYIDKHNVLVGHFRLFKKANILLVLDKLIKDENLRFLTHGALLHKLFGDLPSPEYEDFCSIGDVLLPYLNDTYEGIGRVFCKTAVKCNPSVLDINDFSYKHKFLFSKLLDDILSVHFQWIQKSYQTLVHN